MSFSLREIPPFIGNLWTASHGHLHHDRLRREAITLSSQHALPVSKANWQKRAVALRNILQQRLHLVPDTSPLDMEIHGEIQMEKYKVQKVSFLTARDIRMTALLYIPEGKGPFPAVLCCHGHNLEGKLAPTVQACGHVLANNGFVALSVDAAGAGERGEHEHQWIYHGAAKGADLMLHGDTLLGWQVRDNMRGVDLLQSLPFVDSNRIGATGASGGGNQTMWVSAMDERIRAAIPVVSVGSFEAYVGRRNCICETLPGGLIQSEEWEVLGLIAPRALLIVNALHDQPAFGYDAMSRTAKPLKEIYYQLDAAQSFEARILDMTHGYHREVLEAMLGWVKHHLAGASSSSPHALPDWVTIPEEHALCFPLGKRPATVNYLNNRQSLAKSRHAATSVKRDIPTLARITGWSGPVTAAEWTHQKSYPNGMQTGAILSPRGTLQPITLSQAWNPSLQEVYLILSPEGKKAPFVTGQWREQTEQGKLAITVDLPGTGELEWEEKPLAANTRLHDAARACIWLGYTLVGEWAETNISLCLTIRQKMPHAKLHLIAEREAAFAALLARSLQPLESLQITEHDTPRSLADEASMQWKSQSLAWVVPNFLLWGDLDDLRNE